MNATLTDPDKSFSVARELSHFRRAPAWKHWAVANVHHIRVPDLIRHGLHVQQRIGDDGAPSRTVDLTFRHPMGCACNEALGAPTVKEPDPL